MKPIALLTCFLCCCLPASMAFATVPDARIVSVKPATRLFLRGDSLGAKVAQPVPAGTTIKTDQYGRASLLLPDHMLLKISGDSEFEYQGPGQGKENGHLRKGKVWLRGHKKMGAFNVRTPGAITAIRGTEWFIEVIDQETLVGVLDGMVEVANELGSVVIHSMEQATVRPGQPPKKSAYLIPENAVNWTLNYYGLWDEADFRHDSDELAILLQQIIAAFYRNDLPNAFQLLHAAEKDHAGTASWSAMAGFLLMVSGDDQKAREAFQEAAVRDSSWALPLTHLALMDLVENSYDQAEEKALKAVELEPRSAVALVALAYVQKGMLLLDQAYATIQKAVSLSSDFTEASIVAARIALEMDDLKACRNFLQVEPENSYLRSKRRNLFGYLFLRELKNDQALKAFDEAVALDPENSDAMMGRGISLFRLNAIEQGMDALIKATLISPQVSSFQAYLGKAWIELNEKDALQKSLARAKRLDSKDPTAYLYESISLFDERRLGEAMAALIQARALNKNRAVFRSRFLLDQDQAILMSNMAEIYGDIGFYNASQVEAARALELDPLNSGAWQRLFYADSLRLLFSDIFTNESQPQTLQTNKHLAKILTPVTLKSAIFSPSGLSPYQQMFSRPGVDINATAMYEWREWEQGDTDLELSVYTVPLFLAMKPDLPMTLSVSGGPSYSQTDTSQKQESVVAGMIMSNDMDSSTDIDNYDLGFLYKWQIIPELSIFAELRGEKIESETTSFTRTDMEMVSEFFSMETTSRNDSDTDVETDQYTGDLGLHFRPFKDTDLLASWNGFTAESKIESENWSETITVFNGSEFPADLQESSTTTDHEQEWDIFQAVLWQKTAGHFFELGIRSFDNSERADTGGALSKQDQAFHTLFFTHSMTGIDDLKISWGASRFSGDVSDGSFEEESTYYNWMGGVLWDVVPELTIRAALIRNSLGDDQKRLQQARIVGFPIFREELEDPILSTSGEGRLHYQYTSSVAALDYRRQGYPLFAGLELSNYEARRKIGGTIDEHESTLRTLKAYGEILPFSKLALTMAYRYQDVEANPVGTGSTINSYSHRLMSGFSLLFDHGLVVKVLGSYRRNEDENPDTVVSLNPRVEWRFLNNRGLLTFNAEFKETEENGDVDRSKQYLLLGSLYF
ncbi:MAG: FecR domain-containing protein [Desulfobulbaceae bacterium]|nr:FecR domain-containing protein [Desulfobulbaceae bacterium]